MIVVYDVTSAESFVNVKRWLHEINQNCDDVCRILGESLGTGTVLIGMTPTRCRKMGRSFPSAWLRPLQNLARGRANAARVGLPVAVQEHCVNLFPRLL